MQKVFAIANQKGGVGKTFLVFHLAHLLLEEGQSVLLVDLDPQGNLSLCFRKAYTLSEETSCLAARIFEGETLSPVEIQPGLFLVTADIRLARYESLSSGVGVYFKLKQGLAKFFKIQSVDVVLIDCPPSLGLFSLSAFVASWKVLIPLRTEIFSISGLADLLNVTTEIKENINSSLEVCGLVFNAVNPRTRVAKETLEELKQEQDLPILAEVPASVKVEEALRMGEPVWRHAPGNKLAKAIRREISRVANQIISLPPPKENL